MGTRTPSTTATTIRLEDILADWRAYDAAMLASGGEASPEADAELARLDLAERDKVDGYVLRIRDLEARRDRDKALAAQLAARARQAEAEIDRLKMRVAVFMGERQVEVLAGNIWRFQVEGNGGKVPVELLVPVDALPPWAQRVTVEPDTEALRVALERGEADAAPLARLGERGRHLAIR